MEIKGITSVIAITVAVFAVIWGIGALLKKVPARILKYINWAVSAVAFVSGLASYATGQRGYFYIFLASLAAYFLTVNFKPGSK